jgi:hypothetical protein
LNFSDRIGSSRQLLQPVSPPPPAPAYSGLPTLTGSATRFAGQKDRDAYDKAIAEGKTEEQALAVGDNGKGAPALGTVDTTDSYGASVPRETMEKFYGGNAKDPSTTAAWRTARAEVTVNGQTIRVPISDLGPGPGPQANKVLLPT